MNRVKNIIKNNFFLSIIFAICISFLSINFIQPLVFNEPKSKYAYLFLNGTFFVIIFFASLFIINFFNKLKVKNEFFARWMKHGLIYFSLMIVILIILWPGHWVWDDYWLVESAKNFQIDVWHSYFTIMFMSYSLMLIPFPAGILIIQITGISAIFGYLQANISNRFKNKWTSIFTYIIFLLPAVILNNLYPMRLTMYTYTGLLFFTIIIFDRLNEKKLTLSKLFGLYILSTLLILWRSEGILFVVFIPIFLFFVYRKQINIKKSLLMFFVFIVTVFVYNKTLNSIPIIKTHNDKYGLTIFVNPLSIMVQNELKGKNIEEDLKNIDKVFDIEVLKKYSSYTEIPSFWKGQLVKENYLDHIKEFKKSYINIILNNPISFLKARYKTFVASSGIDENYLAFAPGIADYIYEVDKNKIVNNEMIDNFINDNRFMKPINTDLKANIEVPIIGLNLNTRSHIQIIKLIFWNFMPIIFVLFLLMIYSIIKKYYFMAFICLSFLGRVVIIFLTSPGSYFMYFLPEYIICSVIILLSIYINRHNKNNDVEQNMAVNATNLTITNQNKFIASLKQAIKFFSISGIGWIIDICIYAAICKANVLPELANMISSIISVTFVYIVSTRKTFNNKSNSLSVKKKYIFYIIYQIIAILTVSLIIGKLSLILGNLSIDIILSNAEIAAKIIVTPFIMIINFLFMKALIEKV